MATCKCGTVNEYADEVEYGKDGYECYVCRDSRGAVKVGDPRILAVDPGAEPGVVAWWKGPSIANALKYREAGLKRTCAPWQPDAAAVAAKEKEILDFVISGGVVEYDRGSMFQLRKLKDELLTLRTDPDEIQEALDLFEEIQSLRKELDDRMKNMPQAVRSKVYGS